MTGSGTKDLIVGLQSITFRNGKKIKSLLSSAILSTIEPLVPEIWLPHESCSMFEEAFGIQYEPILNRYLVNETLHSQLKTLNASLSFLLQDSENAFNAVNITLPYSSFDLKLGAPHVDGSQRYFPIRRAQNESQYTLGRTFLQEA